MGQGRLVPGLSRAAAGHRHRCRRSAPTGSTIASSHDEFKDAAERINLERDLVAALTGGCERAIIGYRLRGDFYSDDFSNGIENLLINSQAGFNTPVFVRTVKLKDFPWNGWLRLGIDGSPAAAWNPVAGFTDAAGRLVWSAVGDNAFLPIPYNSRWVANRVEIRPGDGPKTRQSFRIPPDAIVPEPATGRLVPVGADAARDRQGHLQGARLGVP